MILDDDEPKLIADCARGDLVAIVWPDGPTSGGPFSDVALAGREVLVQYGGPAHTTKTKRKTIASAAFVTVCDWESLTPYADTRAFRCIRNVEVLAVVESRHLKVDDGFERALGREGDAVDPFAR